MKESTIERKVCQHALRRYGIKNVKLTLDRSTGYPDRLFWIPGGRPLLIEFKVPGGRLTPKQAWIHEELREAGYQVEVCQSVDEGIVLLGSRMALVASMEPGYGKHTRDMEDI